jgi:hypothetical protein
MASDQIGVGDVGEIKIAREGFSGRTASMIKV